MRRGERRGDLIKDGFTRVERNDGFEYRREERG